jgi:hypothetical protein
MLRIVRGGEPAPDELAALVLAVTAAAAAQSASAQPASAEAGRRRGGWADRSAGLRRPLRAGVGGWRKLYL